MEKNNYLSLSEIILGLREEYQNTYDKLEELKQHLFLTRGVVPTFGVYSNDNVNYYLLLNLEKKLSALETIINFVNRKDFSYTVMTNYVSDYRKNYFKVNDKRLFDVFNPNDFYKDCDKILLSKFNTGLNDKYETVNDEGLKVKIGHNGVYAVTDMKSTSNPIIGVDYYASDDQLVLNNYYEDPFFGDKARRILNTRVPASSIDTNLVSIIDSNPVSELPIEFDGLTNTRAPQHFKLIEEPGRVLAKRI